MCALFNNSVWHGGVGLPKGAQNATMLQYNVGVPFSMVVRMCPTVSCCITEGFHSRMRHLSDFCHHISRVMFWGFCCCFFCSIHFFILSILQNKRKEADTEYRSWDKCSVLEWNPSYFIGTCFDCFSVLFWVFFHPASVSLQIFSGSVW